MGAKTASRHVRPKETHGGRKSTKLGTREEADLGIHVGEERDQVEQERLPSAAVRRGAAAGPLGRRVVEGGVW